MTTSCQFDLTVNITDNTVTPDITSNMISYFASGANQPSGTYRVGYVRGALKYAPTQGWALNANFTNPNSHYSIVYSSGVMGAPGTQSTDYPSQAAVEADNAGVSATLHHTGGPIGVYLADEMYPDNVPGSPNPTWDLTKIS